MLATLALLGAAGLYVSVSDVTRRRIPNWLCVALALAGLALAFLAGGLPVLADHGLHLLAALVVGMVLFRLGVVGGGDAKYYAACAGFFALGEAMHLLLCVSLAGILTVFVWFGVRRLKGIPLKRASDDPFSRVPYGIAIALGAVIAAAP